MTSLGIAELKVNYKGQDYILKCEVVDRNVSNIIGQADSLGLSIVKRVYSVTNDDIISDNPEEIMAAANDVFDKQDVFQVSEYIWNWDQIFHQAYIQLGMYL